jgi:hypothetical protein
LIFASYFGTILKIAEDKEEETLEYYGCWYGIST